MLTKDFFYDEVSRPITDQILRSIKSGQKDFDDYIFWPYENIPILEGSRCVNWSFNVARVPGISKPDFWASAGVNESFEPSLDITIVLRKGQHLKSTQLDYSELFGVVVHELHHIAQNVEKVGHFFPRTPNRSKKMAYFTDPIETEAFDLGFKAQAHLSCESYEQIVTTYLLQQQLSSEQISLVARLWRDTDYAVLRKNIEEV